MKVVEHNDVEHIDYNKMGNEEFEKLLIRSFKKMYKNMYGPYTQTCLSGGLETPSGWNNLVYDLSRDIYNYCKINKVPMPVVAQVKEKFGGLRFYLESNSDDTINKLIDLAEEKSYMTCYRCGAMHEAENYNDVFCSICKGGKKLTI